MILAMVAMLAGQQNYVVDEEALRAGAPVIRQFLEEARDAFYRSDDRATVFIVATRPRQSSVGGVCARDRLEIEMAPPGAARTRTRQLEVKHQFYILRTEADAPRWNLENDALETACAEAGERGTLWFEAESAEDARAAALGLAAVAAALGEPESPLIRARCPRPGCLDRQAMARRIRPLDPSDVRRGRASRCGSNGRYRCLQVFISDYALCGGWELDMESGWEEPFRLRSTTFTQRAGIAIHCDGEDS